MKHDLLADSMVRGQSLVAHEAGDPGIKDRRRTRSINVGPGGCVGDYVPFYFAPRSPMLYRVQRGGVTSFTGITADLIYLTTTIDRLLEFGLSVVLSDRNAAARVATFSVDPEQWFSDGFIDWPLMRKPIWKNTSDHPDNME